MDAAGTMLKRPDRRLAEGPDKECDAPSPPDRRTILVVEDEAAVRKLVSRMLERDGYIVHAVADPGQAFEFARTPAAIDLILTDVVLPDMNGYVMASRLLQRYPGARVIYMSGYADHAVLPHGALGTGAAFLHKPFTAEALGQSVRTLIEARTA